MHHRADSRERIRERVARALEADLGLIANPLRKADVARRRQPCERVEEKLRAFKAMGLLSQAEAKRWRKRFVRAAQAVVAPDEEVATPRVRARAAEILEAHVSALEAGGDEQRGPHESARFHALISALKSVGVISEQEEKAFKERRDSIVSPARTSPLPRATPPRPALLRVAVGPPERKCGVRVTAAELFTGFVRLWWHRTISPEEVAEREREEVLNDHNGPPAAWHRAAGRFQLSDDLGTCYEPQVAGSEEDTPWLWLTMWRIKPNAPEPLPLFGRAVFTPAVPQRVTRLEAVSGADRFLLDLTR